MLLSKFDYYLFITELNEKIIKNIIKLKKKFKINLIILDNNYLIVSNFAKKNGIPFFIVDNIKLALKYKAQGIFLTSQNKRPVNNIKKNFRLEVIGAAHNQLEYYFKKRQNCNIVMLSPIFYNKKYSINKILYISKFNLITLNWFTNICALGGINNSSIKLINLTKCKAIAVKSYLEK